MKRLCIGYNNVKNESRIETSRSLVEQSARGGRRESSSRIDSCAKVGMEIFCHPLSKITDWSYLIDKPRFTMLLGTHQNDCAP